MIDYSAVILAIVYFLVFSGMRFGKQKFMISLLWPAMIGLLLAARLRQYEKDIAINN